MSKYNKNQDSTDAWMIDESAHTWTLGKNATVSVGNEAAIAVTPGSSDNTIKLKGDLEAAGPDSAGVYIEGENTVLKIARGSLTDADVGVHGLANGGLVKNAGTVHGESYGMIFEAGFDLENRGTIEGDAGLLSMAGSDIANLKGGVIEGGVFALRLTGSENNNIVNDGLIRADDVALSVSGETSLLINRGKIIGDVLFGGGDNWIDTRAGKIQGVVNAGAGDDVYLVGKGHGLLTENAVSGWDEVRATTSFTLSANFEELLLLGKASISAYGNDAQNQVQGNAGANVMHGKGGDDYVGGGKGRDQLFGGTGMDDFVYYNGDGRDVVRDFDTAEDQIALMSFGMDSFDEVAPLLSQHGSDTWISFESGGRLVLKDVAMDDLTPEMFIFDYASVSVM